MIARITEKEKIILDYLTMMIAKKTPTLLFIIERGSASPSEQEYLLPHSSNELRKRVFRVLKFCVFNRLQLDLHARYSPSDRRNSCVEYSNHACAEPGGDYTISRCPLSVILISREPPPGLSSPPWSVLWHCLRVLSISMSLAIAECKHTQTMLPRKR